MMLSTDYILDSRLRIFPAHAVMVLQFFSMHVKVTYEGLIVFLLLRASPTGYFTEIQQSDEGEPNWRE